MSRKCHNRMPFYENLSAAKQYRNWGFVNKKTKWIIKPIYKDVSYFAKGYALVLKSDSDYVFINKKGEECQVGDI